MRLCLFFTLAILAGCTRTDSPAHDQLLGPPVLQCNANQLARTLVTPSLDCSLTTGRNVIWCATLQLAWNELRGLAGGDIRMANEHPAVSTLNRGLVTAADLDPRTYIALAGIVGDGIFPRIHRQLQQVFGSSASPRYLPSPGSLPNGSPLAYSYLFANLPFEWAFDRHNYPLTFGADSVACFGIEQYSRNQLNERRAASQLRIYDRRGEFDLIMKLTTKLNDHHLILAMVPPEPTLKQTFDVVRERISSAEPQELGEMASLAVPLVDFDVLRTYGEFEDRLLDVPNQHLDGQCLMVLQQIRYRLDERGSILKSEAVIYMGISQSVRFQKPFLVSLHYRDAAVPYFALWVDNAEVLVPFTKSPAGSG